MSRRGRRGRRGSFVAVRRNRVTSQPVSTDPRIPLSPSTATTTNNSYGLFCSPAPALSNTPFLRYSQAADVYSFGVIIAELITKEEAYSDLKKKISPMELAYQVAHEGRRPEIQSGLIPQSYIDLLQQCWLDKPTDRPSFRRILETLHDTTQDFLPPPKLSASSGAPATPSSSFLQSGVAKQESQSGGGGGPKIDASREVAESPFGKALASSLESMSEHSVQIQSVGSASGSGAMRMTEGER